MLSPLLFNIFLEVIMSRALQDVNLGVTAPRLTSIFAFGEFFCNTVDNLTCTSDGYVINNLRFADDIASTAENQQELQLIVDNTVAESTRAGMKVNIEKT
jgi:Reverse transcriptase (RNA-dependent DNA polymerase)